MPCGESIADAKATFVSAVSEGIDVLMNRCGYSRERATSALLRELNRGETTRPSDEEIFQIVKNYGLGMDAATKALIVSRSLRRALSSNDCNSPAKAIKLLSSKISLTNLLYESDEDPPSSDEDNIMIRSSEKQRFPSSSSAVSTTSSKKVGAASASSSSSPRTGRKAMGGGNNRKRCSSKGPRATKKAAGRKRTIDEILPSSSSNSFQSRARSDSAVDEIDAKIAKQQQQQQSSSSAGGGGGGVGEDKSRASSPTNGGDLLLSSTTPSNVRAKRCHRADDTTDNNVLNQHQPLAKRNRGNENC